MVDINSTVVANRTFVIAAIPMVVVVFVVVVVMMMTVVPTTLDGEVTSS